MYIFHNSLERFVKINITRLWIIIFQQDEFKECLNDVINKRLHLNSVLSIWKVHFFLLLPLCLERRLMLGESPPDSSSLLGTKIKRQKLLVLVCLSQSKLLLMWDHCQHLSDWFPHHLTLKTKNKQNPFEIYASLITTAS